jgi:hypothetical protein
VTISGRAHLDIEIRLRVYEQTIMFPVVLFDSTVASWGNVICSKRALK